MCIRDSIFTEARPYLSLDESRYSVEESQVVSSRSSNRRDENDPLEDEDDSRYTNNSLVIHSRQDTEAYSHRIELVLPDGNLSLPETVGNLDAALAVLWARRQLVVSEESNDGRSSPRPPRDFSSPPA